MKRLFAVVILLMVCAGCAEKTAAPVPEQSIAPEETAVIDTPPVPTVTEGIAVVDTTPIPTVTAETARVWREDPLPAEVLSVLELPADGRVWDWLSGDLNGDGLGDFAVVTEALPAEDDDNPIAARTLTILLGEQGGYKLGQQNGRFICRANEGGGWGDPYNGMFLDKEGSLHVGEYGGGWNRWGRDYCFLWDGDGLILISFTYEVSFPTTEIVHMRKDIYDYERQTFKRLIDDDIPLFQCDVESQCRPLEELPGYDDPDYWKYPAPYLPELYPDKLTETEVPEPVGEPALTATVVLDMVQAQRGVSAERADIPWTEETYQNYSAELGYEPPQYYYTDEKGILYYNSLTHSGEGYKHEVIYHSLDWEEYKRYIVLDDTGEID